MDKPIMIALDFPEISQVNQFLDQFEDPSQLTVKIGMELFYQYGPEVVKQIKQRGCDIFLDLKLFDIPHTVEKAMEQLGALGVDYTTVHTLGGKAMMEAAKRGLQAGAKRAGLSEPHLLGVTELTSISEQVLETEQNCKLPMNQQVVALAKLAKASGCDGVITSALELKDLNKALGSDFEYVVPGIRMKQDAVGDQSRVATPKTAREDGAFAIVVGRPITQNVSPIKAYQRYLQDWNLK
ncbi:orotidine-5'-phosphate decarboxylase [Fructilactobacillus sp. Tb1]|uniref:orotidine-5'-phosphate decarboxylase n=1 Tax=Fructilactobacillus sp. Tb1 TaxID=3422304 RepID=UPI003D28AB38